MCDESRSAAAPGLHPDSVGGAVLVVGAGEAGSRVAGALASRGAPVVVLSPDGSPGVELPPLSKKLFAESLTLTAHSVDPAAADSGPGHAVSSGSSVALLQGAAVELDLDTRSVRLDTGEWVHGSAIVIATGSAARILDIELPGGPAFTLHSAADAQAIREHLAALRSGSAQDTPVDIGIIGSGFLALELARGAVDAGHTATVHLNGPHPLPRLSAPLSDAVMALHESAGVRFVPHSTPVDYVARDFWITAVGAQAATDFAGQDVQRTSAGALLTDAHLRVLAAGGAPLEAVYAIGDCGQVAHGPMAAYGPQESEPVAASQGEWLGRCLGAASNHAESPGPAEPDPSEHVEPGHSAPTAAWSDLPWHWSFQGPVRVFTAGMSAAASQGEPVVLGDLATGSGQVALFASEADDAPLIGIETLGAPKPHLAARRLLASGAVPTRGQVSAPGFDLVTASRLAGSGPARA